MHIIKNTDETQTQISFCVPFEDVEKLLLDLQNLRALWVGVLIAVPSGAGVALSVLGGNAGSLVGVAISSSSGC